MLCSQLSTGTATESRQHAVLRQAGGSISRTGSFALRVSEETQRRAMRHILRARQVQRGRHPNHLPATPECAGILKLWQGDASEVGPSHCPHDRVQARAIEGKSHTRIRHSRLSLTRLVGAGSVSGLAAVAPGEFLHAFADSAVWRAAADCRGLGFCNGRLVGGL